jgi:predicted RNA-binding Zn-ribbon protein involved in translation (DUF1610 family)
VRPQLQSGACVRALNFNVRWHLVSYGPLLDRTHQGWKLHAANVGVAVAIIIHVVPRWFLHGVTGKEIGIYSGVSALVAAISLVVFFGTIRCPSCGANWMWRAAKQGAWRWLEWLRAQEVCPNCGSSGNRAA